MKKLLAIILIIYASTLSNGQEFSVAIPVTPDMRADVGIQMAILDDGFLIAGASFCHSQTYDYCLGLLRVDMQGNTIWNLLVDGSPDTNLFMQGLTLALKGDTAFVAAEIWKTDHKEIRVMSFDLDGNWLNQQDVAIPYTTELFPRGMIIDDNKLLLYGEVANNGHLVFLEVLDLHLNTLHSYRIGDSAFNKRFMQLNKMQNGGYVLAYGEGSFLDVSVVIKKFSANFEEIFSKKILPAAEPYTIVNIFETEDKGFMLAWHKDLFFSQADAFPYPTAIYKLDSLANMEWEYVFAHRSAKQHTSTVKVSGDKMLGIGATDYWGVSGIYPERWADGWSFLIDTQGNLLWERNIADVRDTYGGRLWHGLETETGFVLVGDIDKINASGTPFLNDPDVWLLTLDENGCWNGNCQDYIVITGDSTSITDTREADQTAVKYGAYPNPNAGILNLTCEPCDVGPTRQVFVYDMYGKKVFEQHLYAPQSTINLTQLANGIYNVVQTVDNKVEYIHRIVLNRF